MEFADRSFDYRLTAACPDSATSVANSGIAPVVVARMEHADLSVVLAGKGRAKLELEVMPSPARILIVEDDAIIGMLLEEFVSMAGRLPLAVVDAVEPALACIEEGGIDAAIVDLNLAGGEIADPVATALVNANIPFVVATGAFIGDLDPVWQNRPLLQKPFTLARVTRSLEALG